MRQPAHRKLRRSKRDRLGSSLHTGGCSREQHYAAAARNHARRDFLGRDKRSEGVDSPVCFVIIGRYLRNRSESATAGIVEEHFRFAEVAANFAKRFGYLRAIADIATEIQHSGSASPDLAGECFQIVRVAREKGYSVARGEAPDERGAESRTNSGNDSNLFVCHRFFSSASISEKNVVFARPARQTLLGATRGRSTETPARTPAREPRYSLSAPHPAGRSGHRKPNAPKTALAHPPSSHST